jgi:hypothetical protein
LALLKAPAHKAGAFLFAAFLLTIFLTDKNAVSVMLEFRVHAAPRENRLKMELQTKCPRFSTVS